MTTAPPAINAAPAPNWAHVATPVQLLGPVGGVRLVPMGKLRARGDCRLALDKIQPTMLMIPVSSYNQDHEAVFRAAFTAARPGVPGLKAFQPLVLGYNNTSLFWSLEHEKIHMNFYVDISEYLDRKLHALGLHRSQMREATARDASSSPSRWMPRRATIQMAIASRSAGSGRSSRRRATPRSRTRRPP